MDGVSRNATTLAIHRDEFRVAADPCVGKPIVKLSDQIFSIVTE